MTKLTFALAGLVFAFAGSLSFPALADDVDVDAACSSPDVFDRLECEAQVAELQKRREEAKAARNEIMKGQGSVSAPTTRGFPALIMLHGPEDAIVARFSNGGLRYDARVGEPVTADWTLYKIHQSRVELRNRKGDVMTMWLGAQADPTLGQGAR